MATRGKTTFQKRQKEIGRKEKQQRKAERREQRRMSREAADRQPPQDAAFPPEQDFGQSEVTNEGELAADGWRPAHRGHSNLQ